MRLTRSSARPWRGSRCDKGRDAGGRLAAVVPPRTPKSNLRVAWFVGNGPNGSLRGAARPTEVSRARPKVAANPGAPGSRHGSRGLRTDPRSRAVPPYGVV